jgi:succinate dehydrogenase/fumarate reductase flavoprotein subunit
MEPTNSQTDILIIGGGMSAAWTAISAAREGASVILVDKGFVGSSGVTATAGPNHWWVKPDKGLREAAVEARYEKGLGLANKEWMHRIIDTTWRTLPQLAPYHRFDIDDRGSTFHSGVRGPEYMRALRHFAIDSGVRILDHHPALELLAYEDGTIAGAAGYARLDRRPWRIRAGAVIMATGGCAFRSGLIGSHTNTGDGYLMAAEAGAELSGMEFSTAYSLSPVWNSTRTMPYTAARFYDAEGAELDIPPPLAGDAHLKALAQAMLAGPVLADLCDAPQILREKLRYIQPATPPPFERRGIRLFDERFEVKLFGEGTIRGTGGLRIAGPSCETTVPALYAVGDAATRELIAGATSGGGAQNSAWALTSGLTAGEAATARVRSTPSRLAEPVTALGATGLHPTSEVRAIDRSAIVTTVQQQILAYDKALWRTSDALQQSATLLEDGWREMTRHAHAEGLDQVAARETAAMIATARWCNAAALARVESRGMHMRADAPGARDDTSRRLHVGGLDAVWTRYDVSAEPLAVQGIAA